MEGPRGDESYMIVSNIFLVAIARPVYGLSIAYFIFMGLTGNCLFLDIKLAQAN